MRSATLRTDNNLSECLAADEIADKITGGIFEYFEWGAALRQPAAVEHRDHGREAQSLLDVVGHEDDGLSSRAMDSDDLGLQRVAVIGSTAANGSSISSKSGSAAKARATPTRCCRHPTIGADICPDKSPDRAQEFEEFGDAVVIRVRVQPSNRGTVAIFVGDAPMRNNPVDWIA